MTLKAPVQPTQACEHTYFSILVIVWVNGFSASDILRDNFMMRFEVLFHEASDRQLTRGEKIDLESSLI